MSIGKIPNFSEYQFKGYFTSFNIPNSDFVRTSLNNNIHQNFPFALQSYRNQYNYRTITMRGKSSHSIKMLPLTFQSEIGTSDNTLIKGNLKN